MSVQALTDSQLYGGPEPENPFRSPSTHEDAARQLFPRGCVCTNNSCEFCLVAVAGPEALAVAV